MSNHNTSTLSEPLIAKKNTSYNILISDALKILSLATPKCLENVFYIWFPFFIVTLFAGHLSVEALAIASLGISIYKGTIRVFYRGLSITGATIFGQAYGNGNYKILGILLQRIFLVSIAIFIFSGILYIPMEYILKAIGQGDLSKTAALYLQFLVPFSIFDAIFWFISVYLQAQKIVMIQNAIAIIGVAVEYFSLWIFTDILKLDWKGLSIGHGTSLLFCGICMLIVLIWWHRKIRGDEKDPWVYGFSIEAFRDLRPILVLIIHGSILNIFISVGTEFLTILSGLLENSTLYIGAVGIIVNITQFGTCILNGISFSGGILIATEVGKGDKMGIKFVLYVICALFTITVTIIITFILLFKNIIGSWWSNDQNIQKVVADSLIYMCIYLIGHMITGICTSILVGVRRQRTLSFVTLSIVILVGIPLPIVLAFVFDYGFKGLMLGYMIMGLANAIVCIYMSFLVNWDQEIINAKERSSLIEQSLNRNVIRHSV